MYSSPQAKTVRTSLAAFVVFRAWGLDLVLGLPSACRWKHTPRFASLRSGFSDGMLRKYPDSSQTATNANKCVKRKKKKWWW